MIEIDDHVTAHHDVAPLSTLGEQNERERSRPTTPPTYHAVDVHARDDTNHPAQPHAFALKAGRLDRSAIGGGTNAGGALAICGKRGWCRHGTGLLPGWSAYGSLATPPATAAATARSKIAPVAKATAGPTRLCHLGGRSRPPADPSSPSSSDGADSAAIGAMRRPNESSARRPEAVRCNFEKTAATTPHAHDTTPIGTRMDRPTRASGPESTVLRNVV